MVIATASALIAIAGGVFFVLLARKRPNLGRRDTRLRRLTARTLQWLYLICGLMLLLRGALGLFPGSN